MPTRPSPAHRKATWFPTEATEPKVVWIPCVRETDDDDPGWFEVAEMGSLLGPDSPPQSRVHVASNPRRKRVMGNRLWQQSGYWLAVTHREMFLRDGSVPNKSIYRATMASTSVTSHPWRGPVVVVPQTTDETAVEDVTMGDFRHAVDYFADYANSDTTDVEETVQSASPGSAHAEGDPRRGVKIHCLGAIKLHGKQPFSQVKVSAIQPGQGQRQTPRLARRRAVLHLEARGSACLAVEVGRHFRVVGSAGVGKLWYVRGQQPECRVSDDGDGSRRGRLGLGSATMAKRPRRRAGGGRPKPGAGHGGCCLAFLFLQEEVAAPVRRFHGPRAGASAEGGGP